MVSPTTTSTPSRLPISTQPRGTQAVRLPFEDALGASTLCSSGQTRLWYVQTSRSSFWMHSTGDFPKKRPVAAGPVTFPGGLSKERARLSRADRLTLESILAQFRAAIEARATDVFWRSRRNGQLVPNPEKVAQNLLAVFIIGALRGRGLVVRELKSGVGFVDIAVLRGAVTHLLELKVLRSKFAGVRQLQAYMRTERRRIGWLVIFDGRTLGKKPPLPPVLRVPEGAIRIVIVDISPAVPSRIRERPKVAALG